MRDLLRLAVTAFALLAIGGCACGGGGMGDPCDSSQDCDPGLFCDPASFTCQPTGTDSGTDSAFPESGTDAGLDSGLDAQTVMDSTVCVDIDGDGVTDCAGDCDDNDPLTYPGAPEACGDGVTNDCNSMAPPDIGCMMIGTFVAPPPVGDNANPGTQASPVATIAQGMINAMIIGGGVDVFVAADLAGPGMYGEDVTMVEGISVLGGFESTGWTRDPAVNVTIMNLISNNGLFFPSAITRATAIDGFTINGASGLGGGTNATLLINHNSEPVVSNNVINAPSSNGGSHGILINGPFAGPNLGVSPLITDNVVNMGNAAGGGGNGSWGIRTDNTASEIIGNTINLANDDVVQRGINAFPGITGLLIQSNVCRGAPGGGADIAFCIEVGGTAIIDDNDVEPGTCFGDCVGIALDGAMSMVVTNNIAFGGIGSSSWGLRIAYEANAPISPDLLVHSNFFHGGGAPSSAGGGATSTGAGFFLNPPNPILAGRFYNNIMYSGIAPIRYAFREFGTSINFELFDSNALYLDTTAPAVMSALYLEDGTTPLPMISDVDNLTNAANNIDDACMVTNPIVGGDFHLMTGSMCIDAGNSAELPAVDFEGDPRPMGAGPDIGVDETP